MPLRLCLAMHACMPSMLAIGMHAHGMPGMASHAMPTSVPVRQARGRKRPVAQPSAHSVRARLAYRPRMYAR